MTTFTPQTGPQDVSQLNNNLNILIAQMNGNPATTAAARQYNILASTVTLTAADDGKTILLNRAAGIAVTLPTSTGSGIKYNFVTGTTVTSNNNVISAVAATDIFQGYLVACSTTETPDLAQPWLAGSTDNTLTFNGSTKGGIKGENWTIQDTAPGVWNITGHIIQSSTEVTPFSHV